MWGRLSPADYGPRYSGCAAGPDLPLPGWLPGTESPWQAATLPSSVRSHSGRRLSVTSDSGDTGIGTSCSDSVEDHSTSSGTSSFMPIQSLVSIPTAHVMPSTSNPTLSRCRDGEKNDGPRWNPHFLPARESRSPRSIDSCIDMKDLKPMKKWSSLSKLSTADACSVDGRFEKGEPRHGMEGTGRDAAMPKQSRGNGPNCLHRSMELLQMEGRELCRNPSAGTDCKYKFERCSRDDLGTPCRRRALDMTYSALPESKPVIIPSEVYGQRCVQLGPQAVAGLPFQPSVRTQMWLTEQLHTNSLDRRLSEETCNSMAWKQPQQLEQLRETEHIQGGTGAAHRVFSPRSFPQDFSKWESLMKIKEGLLKQKEIVIDRQKQQITQLHQKIRDNELRTQQAILGLFVNRDDSYRSNVKEPQYENRSPQALFSERSQLLNGEKKELERKLASAEVQVLQLNELLKQSTDKSGEEIRKLEEKIKTRDKYINNLRKKYQKESEQNREKKRRIETLEKYVSDLPTLDDVQSQNERLEGKSIIRANQTPPQSSVRLHLNARKEVYESERDIILKRTRTTGIFLEVLEEKNKQLQETITDLEKKVEDTMVQCKERESQLESQKTKEKELVTTVQSLQHKVEKCLEDGIRLPILDTKQLQCENDHLRDQNEHASKVIENQQKQINRIIVEIQVEKEKLVQEKLAMQKMKCELAEKERNIEQIQGALLDNQRLREENISLMKQAQQIEQSNQPLLEKIPAAEQCLKEMSHCLFDLKALCSILNQRAQGKEPNLSLLLEIGSVNDGAEEKEGWYSTETLSRKLSDVRQLRKDIDELRTIISDCYAQDMGDNCITQ
ncbi:centrosomal protein of 85 kDa-like isoform X2 [Rhinatrema bivittatum]|uniref:centrosomal protein of 85 kDa-like isoform X2 n=1 Tax=Rhinatrema bivittatum TaxID=194408 RepID=UPI00112C08BF|nr:centrosomal protein of 85 kDa-like isoform X2 [Rhinatrema bivittatum]